MNLKMLRIAIGILMILSFIPLTSAGANAQANMIWTQAAKLNGINGHIHDSLGNSIAISGDTIVVGATSARVGSNDYQGEAFVYVKPAAGWSGTPVPAATLVATGGLANQHFGSAVAISGDTIAVGAWGVTVNSHPNQGAVYVFVKPTGGWSGSPAPAAMLTASDGLDSDGLGTAVSISGDTVVAGTFTANSYKGAAYVFVKPNGGAWANHTQAAKLVAASGAAGDEFGYAVGIDGDTIVVGTNHNQGAAYVFVKPTTGGWNGSPAQRATLVDPDTTGQAYFGKAVAISGDTVAVSDSGATITHGYQGAVYIYTKPTAGWSGSPASTSKLYASTGAEEDLLGFSVAISGNLVAAGAPYAMVGTNDSQGAAYVFLKPAAGWSGNLSQPIRMVASDGAANDNLGASVAISGSTLAAGAWGANAKVGAAYVFVGANKYLLYLPVLKK